MATNNPVNTGNNPGADGGAPPTDLIDQIRRDAQQAGCWTGIDDLKELLREQAERG